MSGNSSRSPAKSAAAAIWIPTPRWPTRDQPMPLPARTTSASAPHGMPASRSFPQTSPPPAWKVIPCRSPCWSRRKTPRRSPSPGCPAGCPTTPPPALSRAHPPRTGHSRRTSPPPTTPAISPPVCGSSLPPSRHRPRSTGRSPPPAPPAADSDTRSMPRPGIPQRPTAPAACPQVSPSMPPPASFPASPPQRGTSASPSPPPTKTCCKTPPPRFPSRSLIRLPMPPAAADTARGCRRSASPAPK